MPQMSYTGELRQEIDPAKFKNLLDSGKFTFFYTQRFPYSNFHPCENLSINGMNFSCVEQYYMYRKAMFFGDKPSANLILEATDPKIMKTVGKCIKGFRQNGWDKISAQVMYEASRAKYTQNDELHRALLATEGTVLVEANPFDRVWGIGLSMEDPRAANFDSWRGMNQLGFILTALREELRKDAQLHVGEKANSELKHGPEETAEKQKKKHTRKQRKKLLQKFSKRSDSKMPQKATKPTTRTAIKIQNCPIPEINSKVSYQMPPKLDVEISQKPKPQSPKQQNQRSKNRNQGPKLQNEASKPERRQKTGRRDNVRTMSSKTAAIGDGKEKRIYSTPTHCPKKVKKMTPAGKKTRKHCEVLTPEQHSVCLHRRDQFLAFQSGGRQALAECRRQFHYYPWNCSEATMHPSSGLVNFHIADGSKEDAFVQVIRSAAMAYEVGRRCEDGTIKDCRCRFWVEKKPAETWNWVGCPQSVNYGIRTTDRFLRTETAFRGPIKFMNRHNVFVGEQTLRKAHRRQCACHGISGSCAVRTCWMYLPNNLRQIGDTLMEKYLKAQRVSLRNIANRPTLVESATGERLPRRSDDLVCLAPSPDYCGRHPPTGRLCLPRRAAGPDCDVTCCGRPHRGSAAAPTQCGPAIAHVAQCAKCVQKLGASRFGWKRNCTVLTRNYFCL